MKRHIDWDGFKENVETYLKKHRGISADFLKTLFDDYSSKGVKNSEAPPNEPKSDSIPQSKEELLECIQNLMGVFDTPLRRLKMPNEFADEVCKIGRQILEINGKSIYND